MKSPDEPSTARHTNDFPKQSLRKNRNITRLASSTRVVPLYRHIHTYHIRALQTMLFLWLNVDAAAAMTVDASFASRRVKNGHDWKSTQRITLFQKRSLCTLYNVIFAAISVPKQWLSILFIPVRAVDRWHRGYPAIILCSVGSRAYPRHPRMHGILLQINIWGAFGRKRKQTNKKTSVQWNYNISIGRHVLPESSATGGVSSGTSSACTGAGWVGWWHLLTTSSTNHPRLKQNPWSAGGSPPINKYKRAPLDRPSQGQSDCLLWISRGFTSYYYFFAINENVC